MTEKNNATADNIMPAVTTRRELYHTRRIEAAGFKRDDGLWDIEAWLKDTKGYDFDNFDRGTIKSGDPLHEMRLRLTLDDTMTIKSAHAVTNASPYRICNKITPNYFEKLVGVQIAAGFSRKVKELFHGVAGCTHLTDMLPIMATVAYQTIVTARLRDSNNTKGLSRLVNSCYGFDENQPVVKHYQEEWGKSDARQEASPAKK
ncbi:MAG: DUF2889 domain-containing protein [Hydrotalea sp.]|nr:DUF2889 domain-containing protein [Hydrotalea sp.]